MKTTPIFTLFFSVFVLFLYPQDSINSKQINAQVDTLKSKKQKPLSLLQKTLRIDKKHQHLLLGADVLHIAMLPFSNQKTLMAYADYSLNKNTHVLLYAGINNSLYNKNQYDAKATGLFFKIGATYRLLYEESHPLDGVYMGLILASSFYTQTYNKIPIRGYKGNDSSTSLSSSSLQNSNWIELPLGLTVQLFKSRFYTDFQLSPRLMVYQSKQEMLKPMVVPGFGYSASSVTLGYSWAIAYRFR